MPIAESEAFAIIKELVESHLTLFERRGFVLVERAFEVAPLLGPKMVFRFFNQGTKLALRASFTITSEPGKCLIVVQIINPRNEKLMLDTYLETHGDAAEAGLFVFARGVPDFRKHVEDFLSMLDRAFDNPLKPILSGEKWESTPIDWQGYK